MDRALPRLLERSARLARRLCHRPRQRREIVVTDEFAVTVRREIAAPADDLFDAWLDAQSLGTWLRPSGIRETRAETDPRVGGTFRIVMVDDESSIVHTSTYREIDRPNRLESEHREHAAAPVRTLTMLHKNTREESAMKTPPIVLPE